MYHHKNQYPDLSPLPHPAFERIFSFVPFPQANDLRLVCARWCNLLERGLMEQRIPLPTYSPATKWSVAPELLERLVEGWTEEWRATLSAYHTPEFVSGSLSLGDTAFGFHLFGPHRPPADPPSTRTGQGINPLFINLANHYMCACRMGLLTKSKLPFVIAQATLHARQAYSVGQEKDAHARKGVTWLGGPSCSYCGFEREPGGHPCSIRVNGIVTRFLVRNPVRGGREEEARAEEEEMNMQTAIAMSLSMVTATATTTSHKKRE